MPSAKAIDKLRAEIVRRHDHFSPRLKQVARFVLENPNDMGFESLSDIAARCDVRPSTIVRFAKALGFKGGSALQRLFRDELLASSSSHAYSARIKGLSWLERAGVLAEGPHRLMQEFARENINALTLMKNSIQDDQVRRAISLISDARTVYLAGVRRAFPVAAYLSYALRQAGKPQVHLIDGRAGMMTDQGKLMRRGDLLIATSFAPYASETVGAVECAHVRGAGVIALTDSPLSSIARRAALVLDVKDAEVKHFRFLTASLCLAQTLVLAYVITATTNNEDRRNHEAF